MNRLLLFCALTLLAACKKTPSIETGDDRSPVLSGQTKLPLGYAATYYVKDKRFVGASSSNPAAINVSRTSDNSHVIVWAVGPGTATITMQVEDEDPQTFPFVAEDPILEFADAGTGH